MICLAGGRTDLGNNVPPKIEPLSLYSQVRVIDTTPHFVRRTVVASAALISQEWERQ